MLPKVEAMGFGFPVPLFFVVTGIAYDLEALLGGGRMLLLPPVSLLLFLLVRGLPMWLPAPRELGRRDKPAPGCRPCWCSRWWGCGCGPGAGPGRGRVARAGPRGPARVGRGAGQGEWGEVVIGSR